MSVLATVPIEYKVACVINNRTSVCVEKLREWRAVYKPSRHFPSIQQNHSDDLKYHYHILHTAKHQFAPKFLIVLLTMGNILAMLALSTVINNT